MFTSCRQLGLVVELVETAGIFQTPSAISMCRTKRTKFEEMNLSPNLTVSFNSTSD